MSEIQPADVYRQVGVLRSQVWWLSFLVGLLCVLVALQIVGKVFIFWRVIELLRRVGVLLGLVETHGVGTDRRIEAEARDTKHEILSAVASSASEIKSEVPPAVVEQIEKTDSGRFRMPPPPPEEESRRDNDRGYG